MTKRQEFEQEVEKLYDEFLVNTENRGASYGELAYIQNLTDDELDEFYEELLYQEEYYNAFGK